MTRMMILLFTLVATTVATDVDLRMARLERKLEDLLDQQEDHIKNQSVAKASPGYPCDFTIRNGQQCHTFSIGETCSDTQNRCSSQSACSCGGRYGRPAMSVAKASPGYPCDFTIRNGQQCHTFSIGETCSDTQNRCNSQSACSCGGRYGRPGI